MQFVLLFFCHIHEVSSKQFFFFAGLFQTCIVVHYTLELLWHNVLM